MMMTLLQWKINGFIDVSVADDDEGLETQLFHQNVYQDLTKFDIAK